AQVPQPGFLFLHPFCPDDSTALRYNFTMPQPATPLVIGIAGGSGSGKTTLARLILERVGADRISYLPHDAYYKDLKDLPPNQRETVNFDHPDSLDTDLLIEHIRLLKQ